MVAEHLAVMRDVCRHAGARRAEVATDAARAEALLAARRCSLPALARLGSLLILEDVTVPRPHLPEMVSRIERTAARHGVLIGTFGHAGDGNLHPTCVIDPNDDTAVARSHAAFDHIFTAALELGGSITGEHGVGAAKLPYLERHLGSDQLMLMARIKKAFDPAGILNPGKLGS
ncbi:FAD linked oxidase-like protein [Nonomuraea polychroma]|uniref:FAD linked oxidase-like protein n=1 Tax=Nonomuraea polychroma TaxID=46176 RepID=A0A438ME64_9ACTN|nr:FAD linked oxidase-like protein [Nonomuraea polychroma]